MKRFRAILAVPAVALFGLGLVACSDDDDEPDATVTDTEAVDDTEATVDTEPSEDTGSDLTLPGGTLPGGITIPDISIPDISIPDISVPDAEEILGQIFPGLDDDQISCLADAVGDIGTDFDLSQIADELSACNIDTSDLFGGG